MNAHSFIIAAVLTLLPLYSATGTMTPEQVRQLPPPASHPINFTKEIKPILEVSCANCHGRGKDKGDFRIDSRETFLKGGDSGPAVVPGKSHESLLIELVMGFDPDAIMPAKGSKLKPEQISLLRAWIDQGLPWDKEVWLGKVEARNLQARKPEVPEAKKWKHPVDRFLDGYFKTNSIRWPRPVEDRVFARRVYLDLIGLLPPPEELNAFLADKSPDKRERLVEKLLSDNRSYAEHWMTFWNDMLRNDYKGTGYIDGGRKQITKWLYSALFDNMPYDRFVSELVNPNPESEGFAKGIVWRGVVNSSQTPEMQASQNISQVFMGINMKCASCHDSFVNDWTLADAYALANVYSDEPLELNECDKPLGKMAGMKFLYSEFGTIDAKAAKPERLKQLAFCITNPQNGRLPRTLVNRVWERFFGRGLVEPVDDMEQPAWHPDLLDWLAEDFAAHNHDVRHLLKRIVTSRAYQLPAVNLGENENRYVFRGPSVRRLTAEQFRDALTALTGIGYATPDAKLAPPVSANAPAALPAPAKWIWSNTNAPSQTKAEVLYFRKNVTLPELPAAAKIVVVCDNRFSLFINGQQVGEGSDFNTPPAFDIRPFLKKGDNLIAVRAVNFLPGHNEPEDGVEPPPGTDNPAGLYIYAKMRAKMKGSEVNMDFATDGSWILTNQKTSGWEQPSFAAANWQKAVELGAFSMQPWRLRKSLVEEPLSEESVGMVRAALVSADPLQVALGRPNREQVVTTRPTVATTLQALELTNGDTVSDIFRRGAADLAARTESGRELAQQVYLKALGRKATSTELKLAEDMVGKKAQREGVEDLLWAMAMLPEFQLIY